MGAAQDSHQPDSPAPAQPDREFEYVDTPDGIDRVPVRQQAATTPAPSFTPGPWTAVTGQGAHIRDWYIRAGVRRDDGTWPAVARCCSSGIGGRATVEANAAFIAAAPDLYAACSEVLQGLELTGAHGSHWATVLRAAIAKARGGVS